MTTPSNYKDYTGRRFERLVVVSFSHRKPHDTFWNCLCDCGNVTVVPRGALVKKNTRSCGCLHKEWVSAMATTHGLTAKGKKPKEFSCWASMKQRCTNPNVEFYHCYGGKGITICERWGGDMGFKNFLDDMGARPSMRHTIERRDSNENYCPENCYWGTPQQQARNTSRNRLVCLGGSIITMCEAIALSAVSGARVYGRLARGWDISKALGISGVIDLGKRGEPLPQ